MTLRLRDADVLALDALPRIVDAVEDAFRELGGGRATSDPRRRLAVGERSLQVMAGVLPGRDAMGLKTYTGGWPGGLAGVVLLFRTDTGVLDAVIDADWLGRLRTGAASAVATRHLAVGTSEHLAVLGTGRHAWTQLQAVLLVRPFRSVRVFSPTLDHRDAFASRAQAAFDVACRATDTPEDAVRDADVVITMTSARSVALRGAWLKPGAHVNAAGCNWATRREIDGEAVARADLVTVDALSTARIEAGDLVHAEQEGVFDFARAVELGQVVAGIHPGRTRATDITLFESQGLAVEDLAAADVLVREARQRGLGVEMD